MGEDWELEGGFVKGKKTVGRNLTNEIRKEKDFVRYRFMMVDVQKRGFYWVIRSWNGEGAARMVACGYSFTYSEIKDTHIKFNVHPANVFVDCGDKKDEVLAACAVHGWNATRGDQRNEFPWKIRLPNGMSRIEMRPYSTPIMESTGAKKVKVFYFSNLRFKDILYSMIKKSRLTRAADVPEEYIVQMQSERRTVSSSGKPIWEQIGSRGNHFWDCEVIGMLPALAWRLTGKEDLENNESSIDVTSEEE
jgi:hypothetical protein